MKLPKMILFDYGQTLVNEQVFDGIKGTEAVLEYATVNKHDLTAEQVQMEAAALNQELERFDPMRQHLVDIEVPNTMFSPYLYEAQGIEIPLSTSEIDKIGGDAASPGVVTEGMKEFLTFLKRVEFGQGLSVIYHMHRRLLLTGLTVFFQKMSLNLFLLPVIIFSESRIEGFLSLHWKRLI